MNALDARGESDRVESDVIEAYLATLNRRQFMAYINAYPHGHHYRPDA